MALPNHWVFKNQLWFWSRFRDANPVPTISFADDLNTAPSMPVYEFHLYSLRHSSHLSTSRDGVGCGNVYLMSRYAVRYIRTVIWVHVLSGQCRLVGTGSTTPAYCIRVRIFTETPNGVATTPLEAIVHDERSFAANRRGNRTCFI